MINLLKKHYHWILVFLMLAFIFANSMMSGTTSSSVSSVFVNFIYRFFIKFFHFEFHMTTLILLVRKTAHFLEYAALGFVLYNAIRRSTFIVNKKIILVLFVYMIPLTDELIQYFSEGRSCEIRDMLIDMSGMICGTFALIVVHKLWRNYKNKVSTAA